MENAVEALKIAFAVLMFVMALTLSISSFSQANQAVDAITALRDREAQYTYVTPTEGLTRNVGIDSVITTMNRAYAENMEIYFFDSHGDTINLYKVQGDSGNLVPTSCFDLVNQNFSSQKDRAVFWHLLVGGKHIEKENIISDKIMDEEEFTRIIEEYEDYLIYDNGIYNEFAGEEFLEQVGEYYEETGTSQIKKRVITYTLQ